MITLVTRLAETLGPDAVASACCARAILNPLWLRAWPALGVVIICLLQIPVASGGPPLVTDDPETNWMGVLFSVKNGQLLVRKTTCEYPTVDFIQGLIVLKGMLDKELGLNFPPEQQEPLKVAPHL